MGPFLRGRCRHHGKLEVGATRAAVENPQDDAKLLAEVTADILDDLDFGCCREAKDRGKRTPFGSLADEAPYVSIVRPERMPPFGKAVRFVHDPASDLPALQRPAHSQAAKLLRRDQQNCDIAKANAL